MFTSRSSGILFHLTSLPGRYGVGDLGPAAYWFADQLSAAKQKWWQIFPAGPTGGYTHSPYSALSAFAGNPLFISLEMLVEQGLLTADEISSPPAFDPHRADYYGALQYKEPLFHRAFERFAARRDMASTYEAFLADNQYWLDDYALFMSLKNHHKGAPWYEWPIDLCRRSPAALKLASDTLRHDVEYHRFVQFVFRSQWDPWRRHCNNKGVRLIGDVPIFVAHDSADVWAHPELFWLDKNGQTTVVAGVPPDYFSQTGQRWGNPLYRWNVLKQTGYDWWLRRFEMVLILCDAARLDHFIGFKRYWKIPAEETTAMNGQWVPGPGKALFDAVEKRFGAVPFIAEDLGAMDEEVAAFRDGLGLPGMKILQFAFGDQNPKNPYMPHNHVPNCVVYTGTHDNDTTRGWFRQIPASEKEFIRCYMPISEEIPHWDLIKAAYASVANTVLVPLQDCLGYGTDARMNVPGSSENNWLWRLSFDALKQDVLDRLASLVYLYNR